MIFGPKTDGTYVVEFRTAASLAISIPRTETAVIQNFQERMPYGLFVPGDFCVWRERWSFRTAKTLTGHERPTFAAMHGLTCYT